MKKRTLHFSNEPSAMKVTADQRCRIESPKSTEIFHFPFGLPAFENVRRFAFIPNPQIHPFVIMQALDATDLSFVCIDPYRICRDYTVEVEEAVVAALDLGSPQDAWLCNLVTVSDHIEEVTANMMCPIVVNTRAHTAQQVILDSSGYPLRLRLWDAVTCDMRQVRVG